MLKEFPLTTHFFLTAFHREVLCIYSNWRRGPRGVGREMLIDIRVRMRREQGVLHSGVFQAGTMGLDEQPR